MTARYHLSLSGFLSNLGGNSIHIGLTLLGECLAHQCLLSVLVLEAHLANELGVLQLDEAVSDALTSGESAVLSAGTVSLLLGVVLSEGVDSDFLSHVELVSNGGSSNVKPVWVIRGEILVASSLVVDGPLWHLDSVSFFEMLGESLNEVPGWNILDGSTVVCVKNSELNLQNTFEKKSVLYLHPSLSWLSLC